MKGLTLKCIKNGKNAAIDANSVQKYYAQRIKLYFCYFTRKFLLNSILWVYTEHQSTLYFLSLCAITTRNTACYLAILLMHLPTPNIFSTGTIQRYFQFRFHSFENRKWIATAQPILLYMCVCIFRFYTRMKCLPVFMWLNVDAWIGTQLHVNIWACVCKGKWKRQREIDGSSAYITIIHILSRHLDRENSLSTKWCTMCAHIHTHTIREMWMRKRALFNAWPSVWSVYAFRISNNRAKNKLRWMFYISYVRWKRRKPIQMLSSFFCF